MAQEFLRENLLGIIYVTFYSSFLVFCIFNYQIPITHCIKVCSIGVVLPYKKIIVYKKLCVIE